MSWVACPRCRGYLALIDPDDGAARHDEESPPDLAATIPAHEVRRVARAFTAASHAARSGSATPGYALLIRELARAEEFAAAGEGWAEDLILRWRDAIDQFGACLREEDDDEFELHSLTSSRR